MKKANKKITISILKPITPGLNKDEFIESLEKNIYSELDIIKALHYITTNILSKSLGSFIKTGDPVSLKNISILHHLVGKLHQLNIN